MDLNSRPAKTYQASDQKGIATSCNVIITTENNVSSRSILRPSPFFSLFSVVRPTQIFAFSSYAEGHDILFQTIVTLIWNKQFFVLQICTFYFILQRTLTLRRERLSFRVIGKHLSSYFIHSCRLPSGSSCSLPLVSCRQRRIPGTQGSRPCRWLLSRRWFLPLAPKRYTNSKCLQIFGMSNRVYRPGQRIKHLTWQRRRRLTHDLPELMEPHSCIGARRLFHWDAPSVLLWAWWQQICTSISCRRHIQLHHEHAPSS